MRLVVALTILGVAATAAAQPLTVTPQTSIGSVNDLAISPSGEQLASVDDTSAVRLWDVRTGKLIRMLNSGQTERVTWSPDGVNLATAESSAEIVLWDPLTGDELARFGSAVAADTYVGSVTEDQRLRGGHQGGVSAIIYSPDGALLATAGGDNTIKVWSIAQRQVIAVFMLPGASYEDHDEPPDPEAPDWDQHDEEHEGDGGPDWLDAWGNVEATSLAIHRDGRLLAAGCSDGTVRYYDLERLVAADKIRTGMVKNGTASGIVAVAFDPDGERIAIGGYDRLELREVAAGGVIRTLHAEVEDFERISFSRDGRLLLGESLWDLDSGKLLRGPVASSADASVMLPDGHSAIGVDYSDLYRWDLNTGETMYALGTPLESYDDLEISGDRRTAVVSGDRGIYVWDLSSLQLVRWIPELTTSRLRLSPDGRMLATARGGSVQLLDLARGAVVRTIDAAETPVQDLVFAPDGGVIYTASGDWSPMAGRTQTVQDDSIRAWDVATGLPVRTFVEGERPGGAFVALALSRDGKTLATLDVSGTVEIWDTATGGARDTFSSGVAMPMSLALSPDTSRVAVGGSGHMFSMGLDAPPMLELLEIATGTARTIDDQYPVARVRFSDDGRELFTAGMQLQRYGVADGRRIAVYPRHRALVNDVDFLGPDLLVGASADGTITLGPLDDSERVTLQAYEQSWIAYTDDGFFDASNDGGDLVTVTQGMRVFAIDQFAVYRNRPDVILRRLGLGEPRLLAHLEQRALLRAGKFGVADLDVHLDQLVVPDASITATRQDGRTLELDVELADRAGLAYLNVYVDGVPVYPGLGDPVKGRTVTRIETLTLTGGTSRIEVAAINRRGVESFRALTVARGDQVGAGNLYVLSFGVSDYQRPDLELGFAGKDAEDLAQLFGQMPGYAQVHVRSLVDDQVTTASLRAARDFLTGATVDDTVIVFIAGHGLHDDTPAATYYYLTWESDPDRLAETAAPFSVIEDLLAGIASRRKLLLMDTCESGEIATETFDGLLDGATGRGVRARTARAVRRKPKSGRAGVEDPRAWLQQRERFLYNDLSRRTGAIVFSSSRGGELSYESDTIENGFFTDAIVRALSSQDADTDQDGAISTDELRRYVSADVAEQTENLQHPTVDRDNQAARFGFPVVDGEALAPPPAVRGPRGCACRSGGGTDLGTLGLLILVTLALALPRVSVRVRCGSTRARRAPSGCARSHAAPP